MIAIAISIKSRWCADISNGIKKYEIRSTKPNVYMPIDVYIYATKGKPYLYQHFKGDFNIANEYNKLCAWNGKIIGKFTLKSCKDWHNYSWDDIIKNGCVSDKELQDYAKNKKTLYIWEIDNLVIFDKPKDLSELSTCKLGRMSCNMRRCDGKECPCFIKLTKAPQSWCYVEGL